MRWLASLSLLAAALPPLAAQPDAAELFEKKLRPLLAAKCQGCHGAAVQMAGLNLATGAGLAPHIVAGDPAASPLYRALLYTDKVKMPPAGKLPDSDLALFKSWIEQGASWPAAPAAPPATAAPAEPHWAFAPISDPAPPPVKQEAWIKPPIDRFVLAALEAKGLAPAAPAAKLALLRRVTFDLTGLPPTLAEIEAFLADPSPQAYDQVIDRLLASPRYGERWGRHWLDVARLADSTGMDEDNLYPHAWRYRDYVVDSLNKDTPFHRFIHEQLAGDLLPAVSPAERARNLTATGLLALGPRALAQQDRLQAVYDIVDEQIDTVSKVFLGLTVSCARCHDHKFDPISTKDYYSLASIFASTRQFRNYGRPGSISFMHYEPLDPAAHARYELHRRQMYAKQLEMEDALSEDLGRETAPLRQKVAAAVEAAWRVLHENTSLDEAASRHGLDSQHLAKWVAWGKTAKSTPFANATAATIAAVAAAYAQQYNASATKWDKALDDWRTRLAKEIAQDRTLPERPKPNADEHPFFVQTTFHGGPMDVPESPRVRLLRQEWEQWKQSLPEEPAMVSAVVDGPSVDQRVFVRGNLYNPGEPVAQAFPAVLAGSRQPAIKQGSGRLELAQWLTSHDNPLTARVLVNRVWLWHFGEALVRTPANWGRKGEPPTNPALLDYLARQFTANGWSLKALHRLILRSNAYRMSTLASPAAREADPGNRLLSRFPRTRLSIEQIRDSFLALDGSLDPAMGGSLLTTAGGKRQKVDADEVTRRTLYLPVRRGSIPPLLATFDFGDATTPGEARARTNVAPQALFIRNSKFVMDRSLGLANRLLNDPALPTDSKRIERAYLLTLTRPPDSTEVDEALSYIAELEKRLRQTNQPEAHRTAWQSFCHTLLSSNEFLY
ncbi:MAG: DUF1549 domain-containing protein [Acidobacteriota bacterium]